MKKKFSFLMILMLIVIIYAITVVAKPTANVKASNFKVCADSDGGQNFFESGFVDLIFTKRDSTRTYFDECDGETITEMYCINNRVKATSFSCPNGCIDGACAPECGEIDVTNAVNNNGKISVSYKYNGDRNIIVELKGCTTFPGTYDPETGATSGSGMGCGGRTCNVISGGCGGSSASEYTSCTVNTDCDYPDYQKDTTYSVIVRKTECRDISDETPICQDSDNGRNFAAKGITTGLDPYSDNRRTETDRCSSRDTVMEFECKADSNEITWNGYACPTNTECVDGACVYQSVCGDSVCDEDETCESCRVDCGTSVKTVDVAGDAFRIDKSSNFLGIGERLDYVITGLIGSNELDGLASGAIANDKGLFTYNQYLEVPSDSKVIYTADPNEDYPELHLWFREGHKAYEYKLMFPVPLIGDLDSQFDTTSHIRDFENKKVNILGEEYTITSATLKNTDDFEMILMTGVVEDILEINYTKTYTVNGKDYEVTVVLIDLDKVKFMINGEISDLLSEGDTWRAADGLEIGVRDVFEVYAGETSYGPKVEFMLGAKKIILSDNNYNVPYSGEQNIVIGSEIINDAYSSIVGTNSDSEIRINEIGIYWIPDDYLFVPSGSGLKDVQSEEGEVFGNFDIRYEGVTSPAGESLQIRPIGDDRYIIELQNKAGQDLSIPYIDSDWDLLGGIKYGAGTKDLELFEPASTGSDLFPVGKNDYFILTSDDSKNSYLMQYKGYDVDQRLLSFKNVGTGDTMEYAMTGTFIGSIKIGTEQWGLMIDANIDDTGIRVDYDKSGEIVEGSSPKLFTKSGAFFTFEDRYLAYSNSEGLIRLTSSSDKDTGNEPDSATTVTFDLSQIGIMDIGTADPTIPYGSNYAGYTTWGTFIYREVDAIGSDEVSISYPSLQREALVYFTIGPTHASEVLDYICI